MVPAAFRFAIALAVLASLMTQAADAPARSAPVRPGAIPPAPAAPLATKRFGKIAYVSVADLATRLGLELTWRQRGKKITLSGTGVRAELESDSRDVAVNGLRVFLGDPILDSGGQLYVSRSDFECSLTPLLRPGFGVSAAPVKVVVLDPGHGGKDNGTSVNEKTFALDVAKRAKKSLEVSGYRVILTRDADRYVDLSERAVIANAGRADVFVSIHFNALPNDKKTSGVEVFTFAPAGQHAAGWWSLLRKDDPHLETTASPVNRFDHWSAALAQALQRRFVVDLKSFDRGKKLAHWGVLRGLNCPGVLLECGFLTSEAEARKIASPEYRQKLADKIAAGIRDYALLADGSSARTSTVATAVSRPAAAP